MSDLFKFSGAVRHDAAIDEWLSGEPHALFALARHWFTQFRNCGADVNELIHDGCPVACVGDTAFGYVNVFKQHVNVGFYNGAALKDPHKLLEGSGKRMRHVKLRPGHDLDTGALAALIEQAYKDMKKAV
ncbi:MAG: hypothetical protein RLZZ227_82 [Pseudomonadota bacterium]|jgi:hypothetical protein